MPRHRSEAIRAAVLRLRNGIANASLDRAVPLFVLLAVVPSAPLRAEGFLNPSGIVLGGTATFRVDIAPDAFPDAAVHWIAEPASRVSFPDGTNGRVVLVRGKTPGDVSLRVEIDGYTDAHPVANARVVPLATVKADAWIIRDGDNWARTEAQVVDLFDEANDILSQVGVRISLDSVSSTNRPDWFDLTDPPGVLQTANQIVSLTNGTGGLVYYFVNDIPGYRGLRTGASILVEGDGSGQTVAHEAGHVFGLSDIYAWDDESPLVLDPTMPLVRNHLSQDWGSDSENDGFYPPNLTQSNIVERLLMFGRGRHDAVDIPRGDVWGVWYHWTNAPSGVGRVKAWHETNAPVGFFEHANILPFLK